MTNKFKILVFVMLTFTVGLLIYLVNKNTTTSKPTQTSNPSTSDGSISPLEVHLKDRMSAMENTTCDYTLNLSKSNKILWKACHEGYNRYYIPQNVWFKNNLPNQSQYDKFMCIGKALQEIQKSHREFSIDMNEKAEYELWLAEPC